MDGSYSVDNLLKLSARPAMLSNQFLSGADAVSIIYVVIFFDDVFKCLIFRGELISQLYQETVFSSIFYIRGFRATRFCFPVVVAGFRMLAPRQTSLTLGPASTDFIAIIIGCSEGRLLRTAISSDVIIRILEDLRYEYCILPGTNTDSSVSAVAYFCRTNNCTVRIALCCFVTDQNRSVSLIYKNRALCRILSYGRAGITRNGFR